MATLKNLTVRLGMDPTGLMKGASRAQRQIQLLKKDVEKSSKSIRSMSDSLGKMSSPTSLVALTAAGATVSKVLPIASAALLALPAAASVAGAAFATVATATSGMGDAMSAMADGDAEKVSEAMQKLSPAAQETVKAMHGVRTSFDGVRKATQESVFYGMAQRVSELGATYLPILQRGMVAVGGSINAMAAASMAAMSTPLFQGAVAQVFDTTRVAIGNLTPIVTGLLHALPNLIAVGAPLVDMFTQWLGGLLGAKLEFLSTAEGMAWMQTKVEAARTAFSDLGGVLGPIWQAISTLSSGVMMLIGWFNSLPPGVQGVVSSMLVWGTAISFLVGRFAPLFSVLGMFGPALGRAVSAGAVYVAQLIAQAAVIVARWTMMAVGAMARAVMMAAAWFVALGPIGWVIAIVIGLVALIIANWDTVKAWTIAAWNAVVNFIVSAWDSIVSAVTSAVNAVKSWISNAWNTIKSIATSAMQAFIAAHVNGFNMVKNAVSSGINAVIGFVRSIPGRILGALGNLGGLLVGAGRAIMDGLRRGIEAAWNGVKSLLQSITNMIPDWKGPMRVDLKLLEPSGEAIMHGLSVGIDDGAHNLFRQLQGITTDIGGAVAPPKASVGTVAGGSGLTPGAIREAMSGMTFVLDNDGGKVLAKLVNDVNNSNKRR